jgi:hypothetical protein
VLVSFSLIFGLIAGGGPSEPVEEQVKTDRGSGRRRRGGLSRWSDPHEAYDGTPVWLRPYTEAMFHQSGLSHCNDLVIDEARGIAMVASRGNLTGARPWRPGACPTWAAQRGPPRCLCCSASLEMAVNASPGVVSASYWTQHPNDLITMAIGDDGAITVVSRLTLEGALSVWALGKDRGVLCVTDAGDDQLVATPQPMRHGQGRPGGVMAERCDRPLRS